MLVKVKLTQNQIIMSFTLSLTRKIASKSSNILDTFMEMDLDGDGYDRYIFWGSAFTSSVF